MYDPSITYPTPTFDRVLIALDPRETEINGIILPDSAQNQNIKATVCAVGPGNYNLDGTRVPVALHPGQRVIIDPAMQSFPAIKWYGEGHAIIRESQIVAVLDPEAEEAERTFRTNSFIANKIEGVTPGEQSEEPKDAE